MKLLYKFFIPILLFLGMIPSLASADSLLDAAKNGDLSEFKNLLNHGRNIQTKNSSGWSVLHYAVWGGRLDENISKEKYNERFKLVELIIKKGVNVNSKSNDGSTPLMQSYRADITALLIKKGASINARTKRNDPAFLEVLSSAYRYKDYIPILKILILSGAKLNVRDYYDKNTALMFSVSKNNAYEAAKLLLANGANVNLKNKHGQTALMLASDLSVVKSLVKYGAKVKQKDRRGRTVFHHLALNFSRRGDTAPSDNDKADYYKSLGNIGIKPSIFDAAEYGVAEYFEKRKLNKKILNTIDKRNKRTILHTAVINNHTDIVRLLVSMGADINMKDKWDNLPIDYAVSDIVRWNERISYYKSYGMGDLRFWNKEIFELLIANNSEIRPSHLLLQAASSNAPELLNYIEKNWNISTAKNDWRYVDRAKHYGARDSMQWFIDRGFERVKPSKPKKSVQIARSKNSSKKNDNASKGNRVATTDKGNVKYKLEMKGLVTGSKGQLMSTAVGQILVNKFLASSGTIDMITKTHIKLLINKKLLSFKISSFTKFCKGKLVKKQTDFKKGDESVVLSERKGDKALSIRKGLIRLNLNQFSGATPQNVACPG